MKGNKIRPGASKSSGEGRLAVMQNIRLHAARAGSPAAQFTGEG